jgi:hypothetical protein
VVGGGVGAAWSVTGSPRENDSAAGNAVRPGTAARSGHRLPTPRDASSR